MISVNVNWDEVPQDVERVEVLAKSPSTTRVVHVASRPKPVTLTLTMAQAKALRTVTGAVGGDPRTTARGRIDEIHTALANQGVPWEWETAGVKGSVTFTR